MRRINRGLFLALFAISSSAFSEEDMVEKAWSCEPSFGKAVSEENLGHGIVSNASIYTSLLSGEETSPLDIFQFGKCPELSNEEKMALAKALLNVYGNRSRSAFGVAVWSLDSFVLEKYRHVQAAESAAWKAANSASADKYEAEAARRREEWEAEAAQKEKAKAEAAKTKEAERLVRQQQLRSGEAKAENMSDIWLSNNDQIPSLQEIMASTLLRANNAVYGGRVIIDGEYREGVLRVRFDSDVLAEVAYQTPRQEEDGVEVGPELALRARALSQNGTRHYAQLNLGKTSISFIRNLRIGSVVWVVGRYKANRKYTLTNRTERTMPVLDVLYIGE